MGQVCTSCKAKSNEHELQNESSATPQEITHEPPLVELARNEAPVEVAALHKGSKESIATGSAKLLPSTKRSERVAGKENDQEGCEEMKPEIEASGKQEKSNDTHSFASHSMNRTRPSKELTKLPEFPDFFNPLTKEKKENLPPFEFNRPKFEVEGAEQQGPILFGEVYAYEGQWKDGRKAGRGRQIWRDGSYYEGYWRGNMAYGFGRLIHTGGDTYEGEWKEDRAEGFGEYRHICGAVFSGSWKNDKQEGYGEERWPDGAVYKGEYRNGGKHGRGKFEWSDGSFYEGGFVDNNMEGFGEYHWHDGKVYVGTWKDNKMDGNGLFTWPDGRKYEGEYRNDKKQGAGTFVWPDGREYRGSWYDGKQHGEGCYRNRKGIVREGLWENGVRKKWCDEGTSKNFTIDNCPL